MHHVSLHRWILHQQSPLEYINNNYKANLFKNNIIRVLVINVYELFQRGKKNSAVSGSLVVHSPPTLCTLSNLFAVQCAWRNRLLIFHILDGSFK